MIKPVHQIRPIKIHAVHNGYVVTVGCQTFVFTKAVEMLADIALYLEKGQSREAEIMKKQLPFRTAVQEIAVPATEGRFQPEAQMGYVGVDQAQQAV